MSPFPTTRWTLISNSTGDNLDEAREAFGELCGAYWYPLFAYLRRKGEPAGEVGQFFMILGLLSAGLALLRLFKVRGGGQS